MSYICPVFDFVIRFPAYHSGTKIIDDFGFFKHLNNSKTELYNSKTLSFFHQFVS